MPSQKVDKEALRKLEDSAKLRNLNLTNAGLLDRVGTVVQELTPAKLSEVFREASFPGDMSRLFELYRKVIAYDGKIGGFVEKRRKAPTRFNVEFKNMYPDMAGSGEVVEFVKKAFDNIDKKKLMKNCVDGILQGVSLMENVWVKEYGSEKILMNQPVKISPSRYGQYNESIGRNDPRWGTLYIKNGFGFTDKVFLSEIKQSKLIDVTYSDDKGFYDVSGIMRPVLKWYLFKYFTYQYWIEYNETYGFPTTIVTIPKADYNTFQNELSQFLQNVGRNKFGILFDGMEYEVTSQTSGGQVDFFRMLEQAVNKEITFTLLGQDLSEKGSTPTTYAESVTGYKMEDDLIIDDAEFVDEQINRCITPYLVWFNYRDKFPLDVVKFSTNTPEKKDWQKIKTKWETAAKLGLKGVSKSQLADELEIQFADDDTDSIDLYWQQKPNGGEHPDDRNENREDGGSVAE